MGVKRNMWIIPFFLAFVCALIVSGSAGQGYTTTDGHSQDGSVNGWIENSGSNTQSLSQTLAPEFPTLAVPIGLLVGMIYIIFILRDKGRKNSLFQEKRDS